MAGISPEKVEELKAFISLIQTDPSLIYRDEFSFFKEYLKSLNANIPECKKEEQPVEEVETEVESVEDFDEECLKDPDVVCAETIDPPLVAPAGEKELTDEDYTNLAKFKEAASEALESEDLEKALENYTNALLLGNPTALLYTRRADVLCKLKRYAAAIIDCDAALLLNPDNAKAHKLRGQANRYLGRWEEAHKDLDVGQKIDYSEDLWDMQKLVDEKYKLIENYQRQKSRVQEQRERKAREKRAAAARAERAQRLKEEAAKRASESCFSGGMPGGFGGMPGCGGMGGMPGGMGGMPGGMGGMPGGMGGMGGMPGGMGGMPGGMGGMPGGMGGMGGMPGGMGGMPGGMGGMGGMPGGMGGMPGGMGGMPGGMGGLEGLLGGLNDPEMKEIFSNPKMSKVLQEMMMNPAAMSKYQNDPEVMAAIAKLTSKFGAGMKGGGGGGGGDGDFNFPGSS